MDITAKLKRVPWNKGLKGKQVAWNKGMPSPTKGVPRTEADKKAISEAKKGRGNGLLGRVRPEHERLNISLAKKGKPSPLKGIPRTQETLVKMQAKRLVGDKHPFWKGDGVGYIALHEWVYKQLGKKSICWQCDTRTGKFEWANISQQYKRDVSDWARLCLSCHRRYDKGSIELTLNYRNLDKDEA